MNPPSPHETVDEKLSVIVSKSPPNSPLRSPIDADLDALNTLRGTIDVPSQKESRLVSTMPILRRGGTSNSNSNVEKDVLLFCRGDLLEKRFGLDAIGKKAIVRGEFFVIQKIGMLYMEVDSVEFIEEEQLQSQSRPLISSQTKRIVKTKGSGKEFVGYIKIKSEIQNLNGVGSSAFVRFIHTSSTTGQTKSRVTMVVLQKESLALYPFLHRGNGRDGQRNLYAVSNSKRANLTHDEVADSKCEVRVSMDGLKGIKAIDPVSLPSHEFPITESNSQLTDIHLQDDSSLHKLIKRIGNPADFKDLERFSQAVYSIKGTVCDKTGWNNHDWLVLKEDHTGSKITIITTHMTNSISFISLRPEALVVFHDVFPVYIGRSLTAFAGHSTRSYYTVEKFAPATTLSDSYVVRGSSHLSNRCIVYTAWVALVCRNMIENVGRAISNDVYGKVIDSLQSLFDESSFIQDQKSPLVECIDKFYVPFHVIRGGLDVDYISELLPIGLKLKVFTDTLKEVEEENAERLNLGIQADDSSTFTIRELFKEVLSPATIHYVIGMIRQSIIGPTMSIFKLHDVRNTSREIMIIVNGDMFAERHLAVAGNLLLLINPKECLETIPGRDDTLIFMYVDYNVERGVEGCNIQRRSSTTSTANATEKVKVGDDVRVRYQNRRKWYDGTIEEIHPDGCVDVRLSDISNVTIIPTKSSASISTDATSHSNDQKDLHPGAIEIENGSDVERRVIGVKMAKMISGNRLRRKLGALSSSSPIKLNNKLHVHVQGDQDQLKEQPNSNSSLLNDEIVGVTSKVAKLKEDWICSKCKKVTFASWGVYCYHCNWDCVLCGNTDNWGRRKSCNQCKRERGGVPMGNVNSSVTFPVNNMNSSLTSVPMNSGDCGSSTGEGIDANATAFSELEGKMINSASPVFGIRELLSLGRSNVVAIAVKGVVVYKSMGTSHDNDKIHTTSSNDVICSSKRLFSSINQPRDFSPYIYLRDIETEDFIAVFLNGENASFVLSSIFVGLHIVIGPVKVLEARSKKSIFLKFDRSSGISITGISTLSQLKKIRENCKEKPTFSSCYQEDVHFCSALHTTISNLNLNQRKSRCLWNLKVFITSIDKVRVYLYCDMCKKDVLPPHIKCINCKNFHNPTVRWGAEMTVDDHTSMATADFEGFDVFKLLTTKTSSGINMQKYVNFIDECARSNGEFGIFNNLSHDIGIPATHLQVFECNDGNITDFSNIPLKIEYAVSVLKLFVDRLSLIRPLSIIGRISMRKYDSNNDGYHTSDILFQSMYGYQYVKKQTSSRPHVTFRVIHASLVD